MIARAHLQGNGLDFYEEGYASDVEGVFHAHEETEIIFLLEGTILDVRKRQTVLRTPSTLLLLPAGELHSPRIHEGVRLFQIRIEPQWLKRFHAYSHLAQMPVDFREGLPMWLATRLYREFQGRDSLSPLMLEGLTLELLVEMARSTQNPAERRVPRWLREARDYLHAQFMESLSLEAIAAAVGVHPSHLTRGFRQHYRCTVGDYVRRLRVEYACHLLITSNTPLSQVALDTGFSHQSHFCRAFKSLTGMTPSEYQKFSGRAGLMQKVMV